MAKKKKIKITAVGSIVTAMAVAVTGFMVYAALKQHDDDAATNEFTPADVEIAVQENDDDNSDPKVKNELSWTPDTSTYTADKKVTVKNLDTDGNDTDAYIRVCLIPRWTVTVNTASGSEPADYSGYTLGAFPSVSEIKDNKYILGVTENNSTQYVTFNLASDWSDNWIYKDGYFYCKSAVAPGDETPVLLESVSVLKTFYTEFTNEGCKFQVDVIADSIQADGGAVAKRWKDSGVEIGSDSKLE